MVSPEGRTNFQNQLKQLIGSIQYSNNYEEGRENEGETASVAEKPLMSSSTPKWHCAAPHARLGQRRRAAQAGAPRRKGSLPQSPTEC
jgi:hypothetical protein